MYHLTIIAQNSHHEPLPVGGLSQISGHKRQNFRKFRRPISVRHPKPAQFSLDLGEL